MRTLEIDFLERDHAIVVALKGDAGATNSDVLDGAVMRLCARRPRLVILDLSQLTMIASLCIGSLVALRRGITAHGGSVRIAGATELIELGLRRAKLDLIFPMDGTVGEAMALGGTA